MAACDVQSLTRDAGCLFCIPPGFAFPLKLALLCRWWKLLAPTADCSVNALMADAKCFACLSAAEQQILKLSLLCSILGGSGGGGGAPATPASFDISNSSSSIDVLLTWTYSGPNPDSTEVWKSINGAAFVQVATVAGNVLLYHDVAGMNVGDVWTYKIRATTSGTSSPYTNTLSIGNQMVFNGTGDVTLSYPDLIIVIGDFTVVNEPNLTSLSLPVLRKVGGGFATHTNAVLVTVTVPKIVSTGTYFQMSDAGVTTLSVPVLTSTGTAFDVSSSGLNTLSLPAFTTCVGDFAFANCFSLTTVTANALTNISGSLIGGGSGSLTSVSITALSVIGAGINLTGCTVLKTVSIPNAVFTDFNTFNLSADALLAATVNLILNIGVSSNCQNSDFELQGGTNAAPSGQGVADKATLQGFPGNTVNTN